MTLLDKVREAFPALPEAKLYDDGYPDHVAGHMETGAFNTPDDVNTPHGVDLGFDGDSLHDRNMRQDGDEVGSDATNRRIHETVTESREREQRRSITDAADDVVLGNETLPDTQPRRILIKNRNRKAVVITNQGGSLIAVGKGGNISITSGVPTPNAVYLPAGASRTFTHRQEVWVVGSALGIVDWVEENYS